MKDYKYITLKEAAALSFRQLVDQYNYAILEIEQLRRRLKEAQGERDLPWPLKEDESKD